MKKAKFTPICAILALFAAIAVICVTAFTVKPASAATHGGGDTRMEIENYNVTYDISADCLIKVTERITVNYIGWNSTGFYRHIPTSSSYVKNITVTGVDIIGELWYETEIVDSDFVTLDIGNSTNKHDESETYLITYDYGITDFSVESGLLPLVPVGTGWECLINNADITLILPEGLTPLSVKMYIGKKGSTDSSTVTTADIPEVNGRLTIHNTVSGLDAYNGVTYDVQFEAGSIHTNFDMTPYWFVIALAGLALAAIFVKILFFMKNRLTPVINFTAPNNMDPLIMGKLIDNKVNSEDVTSLIFYWADKGYLKLNLENHDDPEIIKIKPLPPDAADYEQVVFARLFQTSDHVRPSELKFAFYKTFEQATKLVNEKARGLYKSSSIGVSIIFALLGGALLGVAPLVMGIVRLGGSVVFLPGFLALIAALVLYGVTESVLYNRYKYSAKKKALFGVILGVLAAGFTAAYTFFIPFSLAEFVPKLLLSAGGFAFTMCSAFVIERSREYNRTLSEIVGFRNFILKAEKAQLEKLLEDDPQFYYRILPYAQVLDVTDKWEKKFADLTVPPPYWAYGSATHDMFTFIYLNSLIRNSVSTISTGMIARPSSSGSNMHFGGGFGGFSGGGFGGGGGGGR